MVELLEAGLLTSVAVREGFDFDKNQRLPVHADDVDFTFSDAHISRQNAETMSAQVTRRKPLATLAETAGRKPVREQFS